MSRLVQEVAVLFGDSAHPAVQCLLPWPSHAEVMVKDLTGDVWSGLTIASCGVVLTPHVDIVKSYRRLARAGRRAELWYSVVERVIDHDRIGWLWTWPTTCAALSASVAGVPSRPWMTPGRLRRVLNWRGFERLSPQEIERRWR